MPTEKIQPLIPGGFILGILWARGRAHGPSLGPGPGGCGSGRLEVEGVGGRSPPTYK